MTSESYQKQIRRMLIRTRPRRYQHRPVLIFCIEPPKVACDPKLNTYAIAMSLSLKDKTTNLNLEVSDTPDLDMYIQYFKEMLEIAFLEVGAIDEPSI